MKSFKGKNLDEVLNVLEKYGEGGKIIAGGTDVVVEMKNKIISPEIMIDISDVVELKEIKEKGDSIFIGSAVKFVDFEKKDILDNRLKGLIDATRSVGSPQIRAAGTIGGNICNGSPAADTVPPLLALESVCVIRSVKGEREILLRDFFIDKGKTILQPNEILLGVKFKKLKENEGISFSKLGLRNALAIAKICTAIYLKTDKNKKIEDIRIGNGALGKFGIREDSVENFLKGKFFDQKAIDEGTEFMAKELEKRLKGRSSLEYKGEAIKGVFRDAMIKRMEMSN